MRKFQAMDSLPSWFVILSRESMLSSLQKNNERNLLLNSSKLFSRRLYPSGSRFDSSFEELMCEARPKGNIAHSYYL